VLRRAPSNVVEARRAIIFAFLDRQDALLMDIGRAHPFAPLSNESAAHKLLRDQRGGEHPAPRYPVRQAVCRVDGHSPDDGEERAGEDDGGKAPAE